MMEMLNKVLGWLRGLTEVSVCLLALAVVLQLLFGASVAFFPVDVVGNVIGVTKSLGGEGLVGLVSVGLLYVILQRGISRAA